MAALVQAAGLAATLGAGLCFTFAAFLMRSLDALDAPDAIRAMQAINRTILPSSAMAVWFETLFLGLSAAVLAEERAVPIVATALYALGAVAITGLGNVPLNEALDRSDPDAADAASIWRGYGLRWGRWSALRTLLMAAATVGFALAR